MKALTNGEARYIRGPTRALKKCLVTKVPKRTWKKDAVKARRKPEAISIKARHHGLVFFVFGAVQYKPTENEQLG